VQRSRSIARDSEDFIGNMLSDAESQLSDIRRQQSYLNEYLQRMRQAVTEVDLEITSVQPPKLGGESKPISSGGNTLEEPILEEVAVPIDAESDKK